MKKARCGANKSHPDSSMDGTSYIDQNPILHFKTDIPIEESAQQSRYQFNGTGRF